MTFRSANDPQDTVFDTGDSEMTYKAPVLTYVAPLEHGWHG